MNKIRNICFLSIMTILLKGCAMPITGAGAGFVVTKATEAIAIKDTTNLQNTREGSACISNILGIVVLGDASVEAAMKKSGIKDVKSVKAERFSVLGVYANSCTIISGN